MWWRILSISVFLCHLLISLLSYSDAHLHHSTEADSSNVALVAFHSSRAEGSKLRSLHLHYIMLPCRPSTHLCLRGTYPTGLRIHMKCNRIDLICIVFYLETFSFLTFYAVRSWKIIPKIITGNKISFLWICLEVVWWTISFWHRCHAVLAKWPKVTYFIVLLE